MGGGAPPFGAPPAGGAPPFGAPPAGGFGAPPAATGGAPPAGGAQPFGAPPAGGAPPPNPFANPQMMQMMQQMMAGGGMGGGMGGMGAPDNRPAEERFASQLEQLQNMGFSDQPSNLQALQMANGDVNQALNFLLGGGQ